MEFIPKTDINEYLDSAINIDIYEYIEFIYEEYEPLFLFNLLYQTYNYFQVNSDNYLKIKKYFNEIDEKFLFPKSRINLYGYIDNEEIQKPFDLYFFIFHWLLKIILISFKNNPTTELKYKNYELIYIIYESNFNEDIYEIDCKVKDFEMQIKQNISDKNSDETIIKTKNIDLGLENTNALQKIIYLNELGIVKLLRNSDCFSLSVNNLANAISAITGEKQTTIQSYLNAMINNTGSDKNNPYNSISSTEKVKSQLIQLGFSTK